MFSNNDKISSRQIKRLLIFDLFGISSLMLPAQFAKAGGGIGLWSILAGIGMAYLYLWLIHICMDRTSQDYLSYLYQGYGNFLAKLFYLGYALISVLACAFTAKLLSELMCESLLDSREYPVALLLVLLLALYGGIAGLEARARVYEIMFWVLVIPLTVMLLLCVRQVQVVQWFPILGQRDGNTFHGIWEGARLCFMAFLPLTFLLFLIPNIQDKKKSRNAAISSLAVSGAALIVIYLILLGIFGSGALAREEYPVITLMGMVKIPGDFIKRLDALMVGVWFFTLYALVGSALYYGVTIVCRVFGQIESGNKQMQEDAQQNDDLHEKQRRERMHQEEKYMKDKKKWFLFMTVIVYGIAYSFYVFPQLENLTGKLFEWIGIPFMILVPTISIVLCNGKSQGVKYNS